MFDWILKMLDNFINWLLTEAFTSLAGLMYWIALIIAMWCVIAKMCGFDKAGRYGTLSILIYITLESCASAFRRG